METKTPKTTGLSLAEELKFAADEHERILKENSAKKARLLWPLVVKELQERAARGDYSAWLSDMECIRGTIQAERDAICEMLENEGFKIWRDPVANRVSW
jgi:hypothetical protein